MPNEGELWNSTQIVPALETGSGFEGVGRGVCFSSIFTVGLNWTCIFLRLGAVDMSAFA